MSADSSRNQGSSAGSAAAVAGDPAAIARLLEEKLSGIPLKLQQEDFNVLKEILELLETEDSPRHGRPRLCGELADADSADSLGSQSGSDSGSETDGGGHNRASIETRLGRLCSYIDEDWEALIDNYFTGFNYCIKSFSRWVGCIL